MTSARTMRFRAYPLFLVFFFAVAFAPEFLKSYPQTEALGIALEWVQERITQCIAAIAFTSAVSICGSLLFRGARSIKRALTRRSGEPASELEAGLLPLATANDSDDASESGAPPPTTTTTTTNPILSLARELLSAFFCALVFLRCATEIGTLALDKPLYANIADGALYILRGWEVFFVVFFGFALVVAGFRKVFGLREPAAAASAAPADEVAADTVGTTDPLATVDQVEVAEKSLMLDSSLEKATQ
ncbi:unnamed protein product [Mycena citricolor]|uniref:Uncharacterized protein n=1 Tax=Mycena citricolor TaxID=2018698 RepID=A0AAD2HR12_9AGAR|nr:unnamed protein product [Mycena citricolor]